MCVAPLLSWTGDSGNKVDGNSHGTQYLLHLGPHCCSLPLTPMGQSGVTKFHLSLMEEDWVREHGEKLDICMFVRTEGMHPQVQSQSHCKPFLIIFERSRWSGQVPRKKKKKMLLLSLRAVRRIQGTAGHSASPPLLGSWWNKHYWRPFPDILEVQYVWKGVWE